VCAVRVKNTRISPQIFAMYASSGDWYVCMYVCGWPGIVVGIATGYGLDGPGI
jgi:hypothetical protein